MNNVTEAVTALKWLKDDLNRQLTRVTAAIAALNAPEVLTPETVVELYDCDECNWKGMRSLKALANHKAGHERARRAVAAGVAPTVAEPPKPQPENPRGWTDTTPARENAETAASTVGTPHGTPFTILDVLAHPEIIEGGIHNPKPGVTGWRRADGNDWECMCGRKCATIGQLRQHVQKAAGTNHLPYITFKWDPRWHIWKAPDGANLVTLEEPWGVNSPPVGTTTPLRPPQPMAPPRTVDLPDIRPTRDDPPTDQPEPMAAEVPLPSYVCSCGSRFASARHWSQHRHSEPIAKVNQHRLVEQPVAVIVPTGVHASPDVELLRKEAYESAFHGQTDVSLGGKAATG